MESCVGAGGDEGYKTAMEKLKTRFGSRHVICESILSNLHKLKDARNASDLRQLADQLSNAASVLRSHNKYPEVDTQKFILSMCLKLNSPLRFKWRSRAMDKLEQTGAYPSFDDFVSFVERQSDIHNDPVYGGDALYGNALRVAKTSS